MTDRINPYQLMRSGRLITPDTIMCTKCKREPAEINDGDDASGPPVCCGCYSGGPILGEDRRCFDLLNVFAGYGKPKKGT